MTGPGTPRYDTAILDVDGTLVDTNYLHVTAWSRAFRHLDEPVDSWRIHRAMGMGGDKLVAAVAGERVEERLGDQIRRQWKASYDELLGQVRAFDGAVELLDALANRGLNVVLATSGKPDHTDRALEVLGIDRDDYVLVDSEDAEQTKPAPDLLEAALKRVSARRGFAIGDSVYDVLAARKIDVPTVAVLTGGISQDELRSAGAVDVRESPDAVRADLDEVLGILGTT